MRSTHPAMRPPSHIPPWQVESRSKDIACRFVAGDDTLLKLHAARMAPEPSVNIG